MTEKTKKGDVKKTAKVAKTKKGDAENANPENLPVLIVKHEDDMTAINIIEGGIRRDINITGQLDKMSAMFSIKIGIALNSAKEMLRRGEYEPWLTNKFGDVFGVRKAQNYSKLATAFERDTLGQIVLPSPKEAGNWLAVQNEGSALYNIVSEFVGDLTFTELLEKHKIRTPKAKGGWRPSEIMVNRYVVDKKELIGVPVETWAEDQKEEFRTWANEHNDSNSAEAKTMAAEASWGSIRASLEDHGMGRASWKLLSQQDLQNTADVLKDVLADITKALKMIAKIA